MISLAWGLQGSQTSYSVAYSSRSMSPNTDSQGESILFLMTSLGCQLTSLLSHLSEAGREACSGGQRTEPLPDGVWRTEPPPDGVWRTEPPPDGVWRTESLPDGVWRTEPPPDGVWQGFERARGMGNVVTAIFGKYILPQKVHIQECKYIERRSGRIHTKLSVNLISRENGMQIYFSLPSHISCLLFSH